MSKVWKILLAITLAAPVVYRLAHFEGAKTDDGRTIVRYMAWGYPAHLETERGLISAFEALPENKDIKVEFIMAPMGSYFDKLQMMLASRTAPDVFRIFPMYYLSFIRRGYLKHLDPIMAADPEYNLDDFFPAALQQTTHNGQHHGVGVIFGTNLVYYNKTLFREAGVADPWQRYLEGRWTWDDFLETAKLMTKFDESGRAVQYGTNFGPGGNTANAGGLQMLIQARGGRAISEDCRKSLVNTPTAVAATEWMRDMMLKWKVCPTPQQAAMSVFTFESGKIAMEIDASGETRRMREAVRKFEWDVAPMPLGVDGRSAGYGTHVLTMNNYTKVPEASWRFMKFMTSEHAERILGCQQRRCIPTRRSLANSQEYLSATLPPYNMRAFIAQIDQPLDPFVFDEKWSEWSLEWRNGLDRILFADEPVKPVLDETAARIDVILSRED